MYAIADNLVCTLFLKARLAPAISIVRFCIKGALDALQAWVDRAPALTSRPGSRAPRPAPPASVGRSCPGAHVAPAGWPVAPLSPFSPPILAPTARSQRTRRSETMTEGLPAPQASLRADGRIRLSETAMIAVLFFNWGPTQRHSRLPVIHHPVHKGSGRDL